MGKFCNFLGGSVAVIACACTAVAGTGGTHCGFSVYFADNLFMKADVSDGQLRVGKEATFRVYLYNTMTWPFFDAKLDAVSKQFDVEVTPSPDWKDFPDLMPNSKGGTREYFTVRLTRKAEVADGPYDLVFKLFSSRRNFPRLSEFLPMDELMDSHQAPSLAIKVDGSIGENEWLGALDAEDFSSFVLNEGGRSVALLGEAPAQETQVRMAADKENLYFLVTLDGAADSDAFEISATTGIETETKKILLTADKGVACAKESTEGKKVFEVKVPRSELGIASTDSCYMNFRRIGHGSASSDSKSYWRGNDESWQEPVCYARVVLAAAPSTSTSPLAENAEVLQVPKISIPIDGKIVAEQWASSQALVPIWKWENKKVGDSFLRLRKERHRVHLACDGENLYILVCYFRVSKGGKMEMILLPNSNGTPIELAFDRPTGEVTARSPIAGIEFAKCDDDPRILVEEGDPFPHPSATLYKYKIPLASLGISPSGEFRANVRFDNSFWHGNQETWRTPDSTPRFQLSK